MNKLWILTLVASLTFVSCKKKADEISATDELDATEMAQQIGDAMAGIDEAGGNVGGGLALMKADMTMFARRVPHALEKQSLMSILVPKAQAAACTVATGWGGCSNNVIVRDFGGCDIAGGSAVVSGTVTLTFTDAAVDSTCQLAATGNYVLRDPNYTVTTQSGAQLAVTKSSTFGQLVTRISPHIFQIHNDGINRKLTFSGATIIDITTTIDEDDPLLVSGTARTGRVLYDGTINIADNLSAKTCTLQPSNVTWSAGCKCATSGSWAGSCSTGTTANLSITGCGTAEMTMNGTTESITFDRCY